jgi:hypothetical protein
MGGLSEAEASVLVLRPMTRSRGGFFFSSPINA